ncbi:hypothetical protein HY522_11045 [bacterium]|nr:hypothetical protein [bacterium]
MRFFKTAGWVLALALGLVAGLTALPAMADQADENADTLQRQGSNTQLDSAVINGLLGTLTDSTATGKLFVGYTKTNGTKTSAADQSTQDTRYVSDTVIGVPAANMLIRNIRDSDSSSRQMTIGSFAGHHGSFSGAETLPHPLPPESGETLPSSDSVPTIVLELNETGIVTVSVVNTSNYPCTFSLILHVPDTDFNAGYRAAQSPYGVATYREEANAQIAKFRTTITSDDTQGVSSQWGEIVSAATAPAETRVFTMNNVRLAEDAETFFYVRVAAAATATARDSLSITVVLFPDSGPGWTQSTRFTRIVNGDGYVGMNDTRYAKGGSADSISLWVLVATAIVRVEKQDTIWAPAQYITATGGDGTGREHDTVPGALIVFTIDYDNDGNRRADTLEIIDILPDDVDLYINTYFNGIDTQAYVGVGVDTRMGHGRQSRNGNAGDTCITIFYSARGSADNFEAFNRPFNIAGVAQSDSVVDTVAAIRLRWAGLGQHCSLDRDQIDEPDGTFTGSALDPLATINGSTVNTSLSSDSGDIGRVIFAVVIR